MPEGDTIFRTATRLRDTMVGRRIESADSPYSESYAVRLAGCRVVDVEARGKHLLIRAEPDWVIHSHMGMTGSWHLYRAGERWQKPEHFAALVLRLAPSEGLPVFTEGTPDGAPPNDPAAPAAAGESGVGSSFDVFVCFTPKLLELLTSEETRRHRWLSRLGPDLLAETFDVGAAIRRMRVHQRTTIGEAVMNQTIVSGIGNVYKSELLFMLSCNPWTTVEQLSDAQLEALFEQARYWMRQNLTGYPRRTRNDLRGERVWVYGRQGQPCRRCGTRVRVSRQGDLGRTTYWCPQCQPTLSRGMPSQPLDSGE